MNALLDNWKSRWPFKNADKSIHFNIRNHSCVIYLLQQCLGFIEINLKYSTDEDQVPPNKSFGYTNYSY